MIDNFTYTVLKFGIVSTAGVTRAVCGRVYHCPGSVVPLYPEEIASLSQTPTSQRLQKRVAYGLLAGMVIFTSLVMVNPDQVDLTAGVGNQKVQKRPNIIFITTDGLDATHLSAYGYQRETTPFIDQLLSTSLVAENNFPNVAARPVRSFLCIQAKQLRSPGC